MARNLSLFNKGIIALFVVGFLRTNIIAMGGPQDFQTGGNDIFAAIIGSIALNNCCSCNATSLGVFMIWASVNALFFNIVLSLLPNILNLSDAYHESEQLWHLYIIDNVLLVIVSALQLCLVWLANKILSKGSPNWMNEVVYGPPSGAGGPVTLTQPLMAQPQQTMGNSFQAFSGSGQTLGSLAQPASGGSKNSRLLVS